MIGSSSMSYCNFLVSLILSHREILVEYKLMTCLPKAFPVFSPFSFSSRCLYPAYVLFMASSLALSSFPCVHLCPNLPSSMILFNSSLFLCCSMPSFGVYQQCLQKTRYRLICLQHQPLSLLNVEIDIIWKTILHINTNDNSVIIFLKSKVKNSQLWYFAWNNFRGRFCDVIVSSFHFWSSFCCCSSFVDVLHSHLLFDIILTLPWTITGFLHPF